MRWPCGPVLVLPGIDRAAVPWVFTIDLDAAVVLAESQVQLGTFATGQYLPGVPYVLVLGFLPGPAFQVAGDQLGEGFEVQVLHERTSPVGEFGGWVVGGCGIYSRAGAVKEGKVI